MSFRGPYYGPSMYSSSSMSSTAIAMIVLAVVAAVVAIAYTQYGSLTNAAYMLMELDRPSRFHHRFVDSRGATEREARHLDSGAVPGA